MKKEKWIMGMKVKTKVKKESYYNGTTIPAGSIGEISAVSVPCVCGPRQYFNCVDFLIAGNRVRAAYYNEQIDGAQV